MSDNAPSIGYRPLLSPPLEELRYTSPFEKIHGYRPNLITPPKSALSYAVIPHRVLQYTTPLLYTTRGITFSRSQTCYHQWCHLRTVYQVSMTIQHSRDTAVVRPAFVQGSTLVRSTSLDTNSPRSSAADSLWRDRSSAMLPAPRQCGTVLPCYQYNTCRSSVQDSITVPAQRRYISP